MTDVYVAMKRLRRRGKPARIDGGRERVAPSFDDTWSRVDRMATMFPGRVSTRRGDA